MSIVTPRTLTPASVASALSQLVEDFALATQPFNEVSVPQASVERAALAPVAFGAVIADVARALGVDVPWPVRVALGDELTPLDAA